MKSNPIKAERSVRSSKGFLFECDDTTRPALCRDVRGFPSALDAAREKGRGPLGRLVLVVPDLAMDDWLAKWADDVGHPRRALCITRRTDGKQLRLSATLLSYGYGVDTAIQIERIEQEATASRTRGDSSDAPPRSGVHEIGSKGELSAIPKKSAGGIRRRSAR